MNCYTLNLSKGIITEGIEYVDGTEGRFSFIELGKQKRESTYKRVYIAHNVTNLELNKDNLLLGDIVIKKDRNDKNIVAISNNTEDQIIYLKVGRLEPATIDKPTSCRYIMSDCITEIETAHYNFGRKKIINDKRLTYGGYEEKLLELKHNSYIGIEIFGSDYRVMVVRYYNNKMFIANGKRIDECIDKANDLISIEKN